ncbi:MAG: hypothetical protein HND44_19040 [Chloroflexi bacterium]|nr:hypothetical protein [Ardenticatenaceae bacterium]MBL1130552.1 hypothetical protein [Chloroflexota bacterium]NOG36642.1 hypothetical protein [Chloroflexota bacterium]GIK56743.1 MAG: hypothetical protein BroJett015_24060 [Chloroflexota bacterium]
MDQSSPPPSHLFVIRIWAQEIEHGRTEWRGRVQYVPTGEVHYFREWPAMLALVQRMLPGSGEAVSGER